MANVGGSVGLRYGMGAARIALLIGSPLALFGLLLLIPQFDVLFQSPDFHVVVVSSIAACAFFTAVVAWFSASRVRHGSVLFVALGCLGLAILMLGHGLTTPGTLGQPMNAWVGRFPVLGISVFAVCLGLAATGNRHRLGKWIARAPGWVLAVPVVALLVFGVVVVTDPHVGHGDGPIAHEDTFQTLMIIGACLILVPTGAVFWRRWRFGRDPVQFALAAAAWYSACALVSMKFGRLWHLSWWDYHVYLLAGFGAATWAVARESRRTGDTVGMMTRLTVSDPVEQITLGYTESLRPLVAAVEAKDPYTHGHSARVSTLAARLALRMRLSPETVRAVAEGAYLHDIGKIAVPDAVLNKPGPLSPDERLLVETHSIAGWEIASRAPSLRHTLVAVRHHHERWDGSGYPDGLVTADIPLAARIVATADVWDALTSDRAYRGAWTEEQAVAYFHDERGRHFDPDCIEALLAQLADENGHRPTPARSSWRPLESDVCHHRTVPEKAARRATHGRRVPHKP